MFAAKQHRFSKPLFWRILAILGATLLFFAPARPSNGAEDAHLMERWLVYDQLSNRTIDHSAFAEILKKYVIGNDFDYAAVTAEDKKKLTGYLLMLSHTDVDRLNRNEQMAFWINAFNALALSTVLAHYPVRSINDIGGGFFSPGPWDEKIFRVYLIDLSLNDIYHRILRPIWKDNRVHYALSCLAKTCPALRAAPYHGATIDQDLDEAAKAYINHGSAILLLQDESVRLSRIFDWYKDDFGGDDAGVLANLMHYAAPDLKQKLEHVKEIDGHGFDWALNDTAGHD